MPRHPRYVKNKRVGSRGTIVRGDQVYVEFDGLVGGAPGQDIHESSAIQRYDLGARRVLGGGRVFRYAKATNTVTNNKHGLKFWGQIADGITYAAPVQPQSVGDYIIIMTADVAKDELRGGYLILHTHGDDYQHFRRIVGNTVTSDGVTVITVDMPWNVAVTTSHGAEVCLSPYASVQLHDGSDGAHVENEYSSVAGFPYVKTATANLYIWIQTWGPLWINPHGTYCKGGTAHCRQLVFDREGSISTQGQTSGGDINTEQHAGFTIHRGAGPPLIMLQISP